MVEYDTLKSGGNVSADKAKLHVYLYPNTDNEVNEIKNAIANGYDRVCSDLLSYGAIEYYGIYYTPYERVNGGTSNRDEFWDDFKSYMNSKGYDDTYNGCHMGIAGGFPSGVAQASNDNSSNGFNDGKRAVTGIGTAKEVFKNTAIQEALHTFLNENLSGIQYDIDDNEHDLGMVHTDGAVSPMMTSYSDSHGSHGECTTNAWKVGYTTKVTRCTKDGVYETAYAANY